jgi:predicted nucleic acid-binding protein
VHEVLIDTSAWILFLRKSNDRVSVRFDQLIQAGQAVLTGPVLAELMQSCKSEAEHLAFQSVERRPHTGYAVA